MNSEKELSDIRDKWNEIFRKHVVIGAKKDLLVGPYVNERMADWLEKIIPKCKTAYYKGAAIMTDEAFDWLEDRLNCLRPESEILKQVGFNEKNSEGNAVRGTKNNKRRKRKTRKN